jgi:hypothetical protein
VEHPWSTHGHLSQEMPILRASYRESTDLNNIKYCCMFQSIALFMGMAD